MARSKSRGKARGPAARKRRFWNYPRPNKRGIGRWLPSWRFVIGSFILGIGLVCGFVVAAYVTTPIPKDDAQAQYQTSTIYWADGSVAGKYMIDNRTIINYSDLPTCSGEKQYGSPKDPQGEACFANAMVASEDQSFWTNKGIDPKGIVRAFFNNVSGGNRQGASTLTQQYVQNYLDAGDGETYAGKFKEAILALKVGQSKSKEEIIGSYMNTIYLGRNSYGIEAASQAFFGKPAAKLDYNEVALLAGIVPSPNKWDPANDPKMAKQRWQRTINYMAQEGFITPEQQKTATFPKTIAVKKDPKYAGSKGYLLKLAEQELANPKGANIDKKDLETKGYKVTLTIDPKMQAEAEKVMNSIPRTGPEAASPLLHGSLTTIDPKTGAIKALYGGPDFLANQYDSATLGAAQAGSTFKPFTLIGALQSGKTLADRYNGPATMQIGSWNVSNFGYESYGNIDLATATANSVNTVYAQLNEEIGPEKTAEVAHEAGIPDSVKIDANDANVLGTATVTNLQLATAYSTLAAQGLRTTPHIVEKVQNPDGSVAYTTPTTQTRVFDSDTMAATTYAMEQVVERGTGTDAQAVGRPVAAKSGTSQNNWSAWFAGFVPQYATVIGLYQPTKDGGQDSITPFGGYSEITGGSWPCEAWTEYMKAILTDVPVQNFPSYTMPKSSSTPSPTKTATATPSANPTTSAPSAASTVTVPGGLVGGSAASAMNALQAAGLSGHIVEQYSDQPEGTVISVSMSGKSVPRGTTVAVVVSKGPQSNPQPTPTPTDTPTPTPTDSPNPAPSVKPERRPDNGDEE